MPRAVISTFARFKQAGCQITQYAIYDDNTSESLVVNFCGGDRDMTKDARPTKIDEGATNAVGFSALVVRVVDFVISFSCAAETNQEVLLESSEQAIIQDAV